MGGHGHGHDHVEIKVPDWRIYKVEDVPHLKAIQDSLATQGLKDPWLRNEVWRYTGEFKNEYPAYKRVGLFMTKGLKYGLAAAIVTTIIEKALFSGHGHGDEHGEEHH